ncbi:MAG: glycine cleavage system protein H [Desulfobacterales bacterium]|nr:glycine cleavage system protein H [Desulfobacterales bacterium]
MELRTQQTAAACIWMQAGVVPNKPCVRDFNCTDCRFNRAMVRVCRDNQTARDQNRPLLRKSDRFIFWQDKLNQRPPSRRPCIHHMKGRIDFKTCPRSYHCTDCEFDQFFQDQFKVYARVEQVDFTHVRGFSLPAGYYLTPGHTWIKLEGDGMVSIGLDDFAARLLGRFDRFSAPLMGKALNRGRSAFTLGREGNTVTFTAPVTGVVTAVNPKVLKKPAVIADSPYTEGWLLTLFCNDLKAELKHLMFMDSATRFLDVAAKELYDYLEAETGLAAADGGELVPDICGNLPGRPWEALVDRFLPHR